MGFARRRQIIVTADGANNQTPWISLKKGGVAIISAPGAISATATLQRRNADGSIVDVTSNAGAVTTFTTTGTFTIAPNETQAEYRLNMKSGAYVSGQPITMAIEGR